MAAGRPPITASELLGSGKQGLLIRDCDTVDISQILAEGSVSIGVFLWLSSNITISDAVCRNNGDHGMFAWVCSPVTASRIVATQNQDDGLEFRTCVLTLDRSISYLNTGIDIVARDTLSLDISNTIIWGNSEEEIASFQGGPPPVLSYCCVQGGFAGVENINVDPSFWSMQDLNLRSDSHSIDTGDPSSPLDQDGSIADMGAFALDSTYCPEPQSFCTSTVNSSGLAALISTGGSSSLLMDNFQLIAQQAAPQTLGLFYYGSGQTQQPLGDGFRCVSGSTTRLPVMQTDNSGSVSLPLNLQSSANFAAYGTQNFQFWFRDPMGSGGGGFNFSDRVSVTFCP